MAQDIVAGPNAVLESLRAGRALQRILVARDRRDARLTEIQALARARGIRIERASDRRLSHLFVGSHQGVVALAAPSAYADLSAVLAAAEAQNEDPFLVALDRVQDPQNLGAILRSAEASGVHGVIIPERESVGLTPAVHKTSAGASQRVPLVRVTNLAQALRELKRRNIWILGADAEAGRPYYSENLRGAVCLVLGGEGPGLRRLTRELCDRMVAIPMQRSMGSLNVSVAAGVLFFERLRQRRQDPARGPA